ncbi:MAG: Gfo/Idh/MocA family oxidoreductase [Pseudomonadota bacterium]
MKVGIAGMGAVGMRVAQELNRGGTGGLQLAGFSARNAQRAAELNGQLTAAVPYHALTEIAHHCDLVIERLPPTRFNELATSFLRVGKILVVLSAS